MNWIVKFEPTFRSKVNLRDIHNGFVLHRQRIPVGEEVRGISSKREVTFYSFLGLLLFVVVGV